MLEKKNIKKTALILLALILLIQPKLSYAERKDRHDDRHFYRYHDHPHFGLHVSFIPDDCFTVRVGGVGYYYYDGLYYSKIGGDYVIVAPPIGAVVSTIPPDYQRVIINGIAYYTDNGIYYVYTRYGYQVVPQPVIVTQTVSPAATPLAAESQEKFGIPDIVVLSKSGVSDDAIIDKIIKTGLQFKLSVEDVEALQEEGVSSGVINFMLTGRYAPDRNQAVVQSSMVSLQVSSVGTSSVVQESSVNDNEDSFSVNIPNSKGGYTAVTLKASGKGFIGPQGEFYFEFPKVSQLKAMYGK